MFEEYGPREGPIVLFLHPAGLSPAIFAPAVQELSKYGCHVLLPVLSGHGGDEETFQGIREEALRQVAFLRGKTSAPILGICAAGLGAQVAVEMLSLEPALAQKAVLESLSIEPRRWYSVAIRLALQAQKMLKKGRFAKLFLRLAHVSPMIEEGYLAAMGSVSPETLRAAAEAGADYRLPEEFGIQKAQLLVLCAEKGPNSLQRSATQLAAVARTSTRMIGGGRQAYCLQDPAGYAVLARHFLLEKR